MLRRLVVGLALATALTVPACKKQDNTGGGTGSVVATPRKVAVAIFVDDQQVASEVTLDATPQPLAALAPTAPPLDKWLAIEVIDAADKVHTTLTPATNHPGQTPALGFAEPGASFGFVLPANPRQLDAPVARVSKVTIRTKATGGGAASGEHEHGSGGGQGDGTRPEPTADLKITIETRAGTTTFTGDKLAPLPSVTAPVGDTETPGWSFLDVMKAAGIADAKVIQLSDSEGASLRLEGADFDPARTILYIKLNKSGVIRFRVFRKKGDTWEIGGELRGITTIKVIS